MMHSPERQKITHHLLSFSNIGKDGGFETSDRAMEASRIRSWRKELTDDLQAVILAHGNNSYAKIQEAVSAALQQNGIDDDWMILDALAETLEQPRINVLSKVTASSLTISSDSLYFSSEPHIFVSRLWSEENPPWIFPLPQIMWNDRIPLVQLQTHMARASGEALRIRVRLLNLPLNTDDDDHRVKEVVEDEQQFSTFAESFKADWALDRDRLARNASVLESFVNACRTVLELRGKDRNSQTLEDESNTATTPVINPFGDVETALVGWELDESAVVALRCAQSMISDGQYQGSISSAYSVLHGVCKNVLRTVGLAKEIRSSQNPKDIYSIVKKRKPEFFATNGFTPNVSEMQGSMLKILEALREVRGNGSTAHSNEIVDKSQAVLCVHMIGSLILYLNACMANYRLRCIPPM
jgi:hypothetical protein